MAFAQKPAEIRPQDSLRKSTNLNDSLQVKEKPSIRLFPSPASNKIEIEIKGFEGGFYEYTGHPKDGNCARISFAS